MQFSCDFQDLEYKEEVGHEIDCSSVNTLINIFINVLDKIITSVKFTIGIPFKYSHEVSVSTLLVFRMCGGNMVMLNIIRPDSFSG